MSVQYNFLETLVSVQTNLYRFGGPILMVLGTVSCLLSLIAFNKKKLRKNPCSIYLVAYNTCNFLIIYTSILFATLATAYNIDLSTYNENFCRCRFYMVLLFEVLSPCYLLLASVDRILITSRNALTRRRSTRHLGYICITILTIFWAVFHIHALVLTGIIKVAPNFFICYFQPGTHLMLVNYYSVIIRGIIIPLLMIITGSWAIKNVRTLGRVAVVSIPTVIETPGSRNARAERSKDRQLFQIVITDISIYVLFNLMLSITLMYQQCTSSESQSSVTTEIHICLISIGFFSTFVPCCIGCYTNALISKTFRQEIQKVFICK